MGTGHIIWAHNENRRIWKIVSLEKWRECEAVEKTENILNSLAACTNDTNNNYNDNRNNNNDDEEGEVMKIMICRL